MLANAKFWSFYSKHGILRIFKMIAILYQWISGSFSAPNSFSAGAPPQTRLVELYNAPPDCLAGLREPRLLVRGTGRGRGGGTTPPPFSKFWNPP